MTLFRYIEGGGIIGYVIILLSIVGVAFSISAFLRTRSKKLVPRIHAEELRRLSRAGDFEAARDWCRSDKADSFLGRIASAGLDRALEGPLGGLEARTAMEDAGEEETAGLFRAIDPISVVANVAPLLGLLGTVQGMIGAFETVAGTAAKSSAYYEDLARNISIALITTFQGLTVAIPMVAIHAWLRGRIDRAASAASRALEPLASALERAGSTALGAKREEGGKE